MVYYTMYCTLLNQCLSILHVSGKASSNVHDDSSDDETKASKSSKKITKASASAKSAVSTKKKSAPLCNKNPFVAKAARQLEEAKAAEMSLAAAAKKKPKGTKKTTLKKAPKSRKNDIDFEEDVEDDATVLDSSDDEESGKQHCRGCSHLPIQLSYFYQRMSNHQLLPLVAMNSWLSHRLPTNSRRGEGEESGQAQSSATSFFFKGQRKDC